MSARIHLRNLAFNWGGHTATLMVMFFLSPYIVGKLDAVAYGIWSLLNVLTGYMGIFDLGVRASVGRHVALYLGKKDLVGVDETIRAGFGFFSLVGGLILLAGIGLGWLFPEIFDGVSPEYYDTVRVLLPLMVINVWLSAIAAIYSSVLASHDRFDIARGVDMAVLLVRTIGTVYVLEMGWGLWGLVLTVIAGNVCAVIGNRILAGRVHYGLKSFPFIYKRERFKELFAYGLPAFVTNAAVKIVGQTDLVVIGIFLSVSDVREYNVGSMLVLYSTTFISLIGRTFFPTIQKTVSRGSLGEVKYLFYRQLKITLSFGILVYIGFVFYAKSFIELWMLQDGFNIDSVLISASVMSVLALSKIPSLFTHPCINVLSAMGHVSFTAKIAVFGAFLNLLLSVFFVAVLDFGILGVAYGTFCSRMVVSPIFMIPFLCSKLKIKVSDFFIKSVFPGLSSCMIFSLSCYLIVTYMPIYSWSIFILLVCASVFLWGFISYLFIMPLDLKKTIREKIRKKFIL
jgi:O-antigen/teichoic acid export membrane protein